MGAFSAILGLVPQLKVFSAAAGVQSGILGAVNAGLNRTTPSTSARQYAFNAANLSATLGDYVTTSRTGLENLYHDTLDTGTKIVDLLSGGQFLNRTALQLDEVQRLQASQRWLDQFMDLKMINYMWYAQNVFITFMPYGKVTQVDTSDATDFDESACVSNFKTKEPDIVICNTDDWGWGDYLGPGMARLTWYNPANGKKGNKNGAGSLKMFDMPPGVDLSNIGSLKNVIDGSGFSFNASAVIESSVRGWIQNGFNHDGLESTSRGILDDLTNIPDTESGQIQADQTLQQLFSMSPSFAGVFTLPVCVMYDLNAWPTFYSTPSRFSADAYCVCGTGVNPAAKDRNGVAFEDAVNPALADITKFIDEETGKEECYLNGF